MAEDEDIKQGQNFCGSRPGGGPDTAIVVPASQPALGSGCEDGSWSTREMTHEFGCIFLGKRAEEDDGRTLPHCGDIGNLYFTGSRT